jgi:PRTRC genetic system ThiF family protein
MKSHHIHPELLKHKVRVLVVGCGGNGSAVAAGLPYLHQALLACGHPEGLHVTLLDPDAISATNCVRQAFSQSEIGLYKSVVLANRLIMFWGLDWEGIPERLDPKRRLDGVDIVIGCVDTRKARAAIAKWADDWSEVDYWLDLGNHADSGQFVLGEPLNRRNRRHRLRLRTISELFPEVIQTGLDGDGLPTCSAAESLDRQEPFVNPTLANHALALLARLSRYGTIGYHGAFVSVSSVAAVQPLRVDPNYWQRLRRGVRSRRTIRPVILEHH